ncbi:MAG: S41 family peptidase [Planctomycetaceae bacterium]|nr:S41 family peptidase [Planctomycetaceae bacterium]
MKTSFSNRRNAGVWMKWTLAVLVVLGAAFKADAQDPYGAQTPFPGLDGTYHSTTPVRTDDYFNDGYHSRYPTRTTPANNDFNDRWSPQDFDSGRRWPTPTRNDRDFDFPASTPTYPTTPTRDRMPVVDPELEQLQKQQQNISFRYSNPVLMRFMQTLDVNRAVTLYREISDMVDRRHMNPSSYSDRVEKSLENLSAAAENTDFQQANNLRLSAAGIDTFQQAMTSVSRQMNVRTRSDAEKVMSQSMSAARQYLGLPAEVVAMEFIFGTTDTLDKYSAFVPDDVRQGPSASAVEDSVVGIGVEVKPTEGGIRIERVLPNGPAHEAGLEAGDVIVNIDGRSIGGMSFNQAVDMIGGPSGSRLSLGLKRSSGPAFAVSMIRRRVEIESVSEVRMLDSNNGVGYIRLDKFAEKSSAEMDAALWKLHNAGMKSLVFDLRGNPGGLLTTAIELSDKFLPQGVIVSTRGRLAQDNMSESAQRSRTWKVPLVVLVDENSASASEIFSAAIQENGRGVIVGRKSYGKGTVQTHFPLNSVSGALRLTTAKFYSPNDREMAGAGVTPDVMVDDFKLETRQLKSGDKDLQAALRIAPRPELAQMAERSAQPRTPGMSISDTRF